MAEKVRFLSPRWFDVVARALDAQPCSDGEEPVAASHVAASHFAVRHVVVGGPDGDVEYVVRLAGGRFQLEAGAGGPAELEVTQGYETAAAISQGRLTPSSAFAQGLLKVGGSVGVLAANHEAFAALGRLLAPLRERTVY